MCLEDRGITESTRGRYYRAVSQALPYVENSRLGLEDSLAQWIEKQYREGEGITTVSDCLSGFHHFLPWSRGRLSKPWKLFKIWRKAERPRQAPPLPECVLLGMIGRLLEVEQLDFAVCLVLGFYGMLRTGELLSLRWNQVMLGMQDLVLQLGFTKTGLRRAIDENVVIHQPLALLLTKALWEVRYRQHRLTDLIWTEGSQKFRDQFRAVVSFFKLSPLFKPYSLRRGGATQDFRAHGSMERTLLRGRWGSTGAARNYVQEGLSELTRLQLTPHSAALLKHYATAVQ